MTAIRKTLLLLFGGQGSPGGGAWDTRLDVVPQTLRWTAYGLTAYGGGGILDRTITELRHGASGRFGWYVFGAGPQHEILGVVAATVVGHGQLRSGVRGDGWALNLADLTAETVASGRVETCAARGRSTWRIARSEQDADLLCALAGAA